VVKTFILFLGNTPFLLRNGEWPFLEKALFC